MRVTSSNYDSKGFYNLYPLKQAGFGQIGESILIIIYFYPQLYRQVSHTGPLC